MTCVTPGMDPPEAPFQIGPRALPQLDLDYPRRSNYTSEAANGEDDMARMAGIESHKASWITRFIFWALRRRTGRVGTSFEIAGHHPAFLSGWMAMEYGLERSKRVVPKLVKLAELKTSMLIGCPT